MAYARSERIGTFPKYSVLAAKDQTKGNTLHLAALVILLSN